jgi:hypothetical protein
MAPRAHPPALAHSELHEILPDIFFVTGTIRMSGPVPVSFSRNMTVVREGSRLVLINSVRLDDDGLKRLDALGKVTDVVRIAAFHGMDDPFYKERYGAKVSVVKGQRYVSGFDMSVAETYLAPDAELEASSGLPLSGAQLYVMGGTPPEGMLLLEREGGVLVSGDCLQNWHTPDKYFSLVGRLAMRAMGFIKPYNVGPAWLKQTKPPVPHLLGLLDLPFTHVLPAHGGAVLGDAKNKYRARIDALRGTALRPLT